jgi:hypothetical protein
MKEINVTRFMADALQEQFTLVEDNDEEGCPDSIEGEVIVAKIDFDELLSSINQSYSEEKESIEDIEYLKKEIEGEECVLVYWTS